MLRSPATRTFGVVVVCVFTLACGSAGTPVAPLSPTEIGLNSNTLNGDAPNAQATDTPADPRTDEPIPAEPVPSISIARDAIFVGAGDIADCGGNTDATARLLDRIGGSVFTLGDNVYPVASARTFANCFEPTWGRHRGHMFPTSGNHDWDEADMGAAYFAYFGGEAGPPGQGYYSFDLEGWHILSLNSNISAAPGSPQYEWVRRDLRAAAPGVCSLAYWHYPVFSSGAHGGIRDMRHMWRLLDSAGVDVVLSSHDHNYERFAPQDADGRADRAGMRQFVVGTGGAPLRRIVEVQPNSEVRNDGTHGVLKLTLQASTYAWEFVPVPGKAFTDMGTGECVK